MSQSLMTARATASCARGKIQTIKTRPTKPPGMRPGSGSKICSKRSDSKARNRAGTALPLLALRETRWLEQIIANRTTPKTRDGNKWKDLDAVTVFDWGQ